MYVLIIKRKQRVPQLSQNLTPSSKCFNCFPHLWHRKRRLL